MKAVICCTRLFITACAWLGVALAAHAGPGLAAPQADTWWPQWQARLQLQAASSASPGLSGQSGGAAGLTAQRSIQSGALLGDYYFASPLAGHFRASGGLMVGTLGGAPLGFVAASTSASNVSAGLAAGSAVPARLGVSLLTAAAPAPGLQATDGADAVPYLGLGYSGSLWRDSISLTADLGLVSERPGAAGNVGRAVFGNQGMSQALREMRLSPVLQLGMRYTF